MASSFNSFFWFPGVEEKKEERKKKLFWWNILTIKVVYPPESGETCLPSLCLPADPHPAN